MISAQRIVSSITWHVSRSQHRWELDFMNKNEWTWLNDLLLVMVCRNLLFFMSRKRVSCYRQVLCTCCSSRPLNNFWWRIKIATTKNLKHLFLHRLFFFFFSFFLLYFTEKKRSRSTLLIFNFRLLFDVNTFVYIVGFLIRVSDLVINLFSFFLYLFIHSFSKSQLSFFRFSRFWIKYIYIYIINNGTKSTQNRYCWFKCCW